jgi:exosortase A-associated hydrolase 1
MRRIIDFECEGDRLVGTIDGNAAITGLLIVSGGNEIRCGAYAGQAAMAAHFAARGTAIFRYDRRGIGDSEGSNGGFANSAADIAAAVTAFRREMPGLERVIAFGNCDAATSLALFQSEAGLDGLILANPWAIDAQNDEGAPSVPSAAAIRARYWSRLADPESIRRLLSGKIDLRKLASGLVKASARDAPSTLGARLADALAKCTVTADILIAERDMTALAFMSVWKNGLHKRTQAMTHIRLSAIDAASHSFADLESKAWLYQQIEARISGS